MMIDLVISASRSSVPAELLTGECQCPSVDGTRSGDTGTSYLTLHYSDISGDISKL